MLNNTIRIVNTYKDSLKATNISRVFEYQNKNLFKYKDEFISVADELLNVEKQFEDELSFNTEIISDLFGSFSAQRHADGADDDRLTGTGFT